MKKLLSLIMATTMTLSLVACGSSSEGSTGGSTTPGTTPTGGSDLGSPVHLLVSLTAVSTDTHPKAFVAFKEHVEEASGGNITVEIHTDASLFPQTEEVVAVVMGDCDMTLTAASWLTTNSPWVSMFTAGYLFKNYDHMTNVLNGEIGAQVFDKVAEEQGLLPLGAWYLGSRQVSLSADKAVNTPADLSGITLRMPNSDAWLFLGEALGANAAPGDFSELYLSLSTGVFGGQDNPLPTLESAKFYEVQKAVVLTNHLVDSVWPAINLDKWNSMTEAQQAIVMEGVEVGRAYCDDTNNALEAELVAFFEEQGLSIYNPDIDAFQTYAMDKYLNNSISSTWDMEIYDQINTMGADY